MENERVFVLSPATYNGKGGQTKKNMLYSIKNYHTIREYCSMPCHHRSVLRRNRFVRNSQLYFGQKIRIIYVIDNIYIIVILKTEKKIRFKIKRTVHYFVSFTNINHDIMQAEYRLKYVRNLYP